MKQHITPKQLNELSKKGKKKIFKWTLKKKYYHYHGPSQSVTPNGVVISKDYEKYCVMDNLSIGQMIEFLDETNMGWDFYIGEDWGREGIRLPSAKNLCDVLWQVVKEELEK